MFRYSQAELEEMQAQVEYLLQRDLIRPSISPFGAPNTFCQKAPTVHSGCVWIIEP